MYSTCSSNNVYNYHNMRPTHYSESCPIHSVYQCYIPSQELCTVKWKLIAVNCILSQRKTPQNYMLKMFPYRRYMDHDFVDLHKVDGLRGVYVASQLNVGQVGHRQISSLISFDKGGEWRKLNPPSEDASGKPVNCHLVSC